MLPIENQKSIGSEFALSVVIACPVKLGDDSRASAITANALPPPAGHKKSKKPGFDPPMTIIRILGGLALIGLAAGAAQAQPRITDAADANACRQALAVAKLAFGSAAPKLSDAAPAMAADKPSASGIVLAPDGSRGESVGFIVDATAIERAASGGPLKALFLQGAPADGFRFVVTRQKMNWQGDWYGLYVADAKLGADKLADLLAADKVEGASIVFDRAWQQPWLVRDPQSLQIVGIDTQHPAEFLADWIVTRIADGAPAKACRIAFRPPVETAPELLPAGPLRELAALLDEIVGVPAQDEGTFNATGRIRVAATQAWANAALRPWATESPYNSQAEIENGLKAWSRKSATFGAQYRRMNALYPRALAALEAHYRTALGKPPREAAPLAKQSLDRAVGAHFVFPRGS